MTIISGNQFGEFSIPLAFGNRYFILEPSAAGLQVSVFLDQGGAIPVFEILKNEPIGNPNSHVINSLPGILVTSDNAKKQIYQLQVGHEVLVKFRLENETDFTVHFSKEKIQAGGVTLENSSFQGVIGVVVEPNGAVGVGGALPKSLLHLFG